MSTKTRQANNSEPTERASAGSAKRKPRPKASTSSAAALAEPIHALPASAAVKTSKRDQLTALLVRDEGATIGQMIAATSWLPHTVRAALTGLRKQGYAIDSDKVDGLRTYRAVAPQ